MLEIQDLPPLVCGEAAEFDEVTAIDNCSDVTITFEDVMIMDVCAGGEATRTWTATDDCGNSASISQSVTLLPDLEAPEFTFIPVDYEIDCNGQVEFGDATATDNCGTVTLDFVDDQTGDICSGGIAASRTLRISCTLERSPYILRLSRRNISRRI